MSKPRIDDVRAAVLKFVRDAVHDAIQLDTPLVADGLLDSFTAVELLTYLENEFSVRIDIDGITLDDLADVNRIAKLVAGDVSRP